MSDATKIPFEPIPVPPVGPLPSMPPLSDPVKPSFSRSTTPPAPAPRKPIIDDDMIPLSKFLPAGIAPETPEPAKPEAAPATPASWLRRKRLQLVMGAASLGGAAYGLHELAPNLKPQANAEPPAEVAKLAAAAPVSPRIAVERGPELPKPSVAFERTEELKPLGPIPSAEEPAALKLTAGVAPLPVPAMPTEIQATPPAITLPPVEPAPAVALPPVVPVVVPESPKPAPVLPPVQLDPPAAPPAAKPIPLPPPVEPSALPVLPPVEAEKPKPVPVVPVEAPKPVVPAPAPVDLPKPVALPLPEPAPAPAVVTAPAPTPAPSPAPAPSASNVATVPVVQPEPPKPVVVGEPKTDYDVDVHRVRNSETYQSLSEKYYGSPQYAGALRAYNRGADLGQLKEVHVPPMYIIRKMAPAPATPQPEIVTAGAEPAWTGVGAPKNGGDVRFETYRVPRPGMTMRDVAKAVYGRENEWPRVDNRRNIKYRPDEELPVGAELQVPVERPDWR
jgi:hypothetical protein